jgi:hypothetical protein
VDTDEQPQEWADADEPGQCQGARERGEGRVPFGLGGEMWHHGSGDHDLQANAGKARDGVLTTLAVLIGLLALSNFTKPLSQAMAPASNAGFVFFGHRLQGLANAIVGPSFGLLLAGYAYGVWTMRSWAVPLSVAYASYVLVNLLLFALNPPAGSDVALIGFIGYAAVAIGVSSGGAYYLYRNRNRLS